MFVIMQGSPRSSLAATIKAGASEWEEEEAKGWEWEAGEVSDFTLVFEDVGTFLSDTQLSIVRRYVRRPSPRFVSTCIILVWTGFSLTKLIFRRTGWVRRRTRR